MNRTPPRANPWPFLAFVALCLFWFALLLRSDGSAPVIAAPSGQVVLIQTVVVTPTRTPTPASTPTVAVVVVTATRTPSPAVPYCDQAESGQACWKLAEVPTPTTIPPCSAVRSNYGAVLCVKEDSPTSAKEATG